MHQFHTTREQRFIDLAATLADDFAQRAAQHDEDGSFPHENYVRLKNSGYTIMTIPEELGGNGASLLERIKAQERLGQGCGPTALAINMHFNAVGLLIDLWRKFQDSKRADILRQIAAERLICGGSASEPDNAIPVLRPRATAERVDGGWRVSGRKIFSTQSIALDRYFSEALWQEGPEGETIVSFLIPPDTPGLTFKDDWYTMGMRATASRGTELTNVFVPASAVTLLRPAFTRGGITNLFLRAPFTIAAPYIGIAVAARDFVVEFMRERLRFPLNKPMSHLPSVYNKVGEMDMLIETSRAILWKAAAEADIEEPQTWARKSVTARTVAMENAVRVVDLALRAVGGASYFKRFPLERYYRDVRAALFHPVGTDQTFELLGKTAFGIPMLDDDAIWA